MPQWSRNALSILCGAKETAEFCREKRHRYDSMYRTTPFQNPATARTAGSCERTGATKAPVLSPAILLTGRFTPDSGGNCALTTVIDFRHTAPTRGASSLWQATDTSLSLFARHSPSHGQTGAVFPLSGLRPAGRAKWVRASARVAGHPAAPSPTKSDRRSACPTCPKTGPLFHLSTLQRLIFISSDSHLSPFTEAVSYFCRSRSQWRRNVVGGSFSRSAALRILPYRS